MTPTGVLGVAVNAVTEHGGALEAAAERGGAVNAVTEHGGALEAAAEHGGAVKAVAERGGATVLVVGAMGVVVVVLVGVLAVAGTVRDVHRARSAADLAALAAARPLSSGGGVDCAAGAAVAAANGAVLTGCTSQADGSVVVAAAVGRHWGPSWAGLPAVVAAQARAGLVDAPPSSLRPADP